MQQRRVRKLKTAVVVFGDPARSDGTTIRAVRIRSCLASFSDATIVGLHIEDDRGARARVLKSRQVARWPLWLAHLLKVFSRLRCDVVYACSDWYGFAVYFMFSKLFRFKIVIEAHGILSEENRAWGKPLPFVSVIGLWERFVVQASDMTVALSRSIFNFYGRYAKRIELIPVFLDTQTYKRSYQSREELRKRYGVQGHDLKLVGIIGPFDSRFNESFPAFVYENLDKFDSRIRFALVGDCRTRIDDQRLLYLGYVEDYAGFLSCLDAVLVPRRRATSGPPNKLLEPMSASLPVFTTPEGAVAVDHLHHGSNIFIFPENELASGLNTFLFDENLMREVGARARETVERYYSNQAYGTKLREALESLAVHGTHV
jgi:glycosyltransferase involved in cell wall biosynthesis